MTFLLDSVNVKRINVNVLMLLKMHVEFKIYRDNLHIAS